MSEITTTKIIPVILSGGMGTRLWPLSRENHPKQFLNLGNKDSCMITDTIVRVDDNAKFESPIIICNEEHRFLVADRVFQTGIEDATIILEPCSRNTAPALAVVANYIDSIYEDAYMLVLPSDHIIKDAEAFLEAVDKGFELAKKANLVTFGINPTEPETGFGYIKYGDKLGDGFKVQSFTEKPTIDVAQEYIKSKQYGWNSGIFLFPANLYLSELSKFKPDLAKLAKKSYDNRKENEDFIRIGKNTFSQIKAESIDYAVMENTKKAAVIPVECGWSDAGSWESLWNSSEKDEHENVKIGESFNLDTTNCYISCNDGPHIATLGVKDLVIISTKDSVMVANKNRSQHVKDLVDEVKKTRNDLVQNYRKVHRPWGAYDSIDSGSRHQVKRITVKPGAKLSQQMHYHRAEHWIVVRGTAIVECDGKQEIITENQSIYIPCGTVHRIENQGKIDLDIIEVQSGAYLGEDDIVRFDDNYGRTG